ncbi:LOW QUALITY PROTEIN: hypothetical protein HID58_055123, partial [Brassica napus]
FPSPTRDASAAGSPLDDFDLIHRDALRDIENMTLSQCLLVADAHRLIRDEGADRVEVGSSDVSGSENRGGDQSDDATDSERDDADASGRSPTPSRRVRKRVRFDQIDCRSTVYHPGGIFEELAPLPPGLLRDPRAQSWGNEFGSCASHHASRLPCVLGLRKSRLPLFTRKQQRLLDKAREMDGVPDLSALLKGKLELLSKKSTTVDPQGPSNSGGDSSSEGGGTSREGASRERVPIVVDEGVGAETSASGPKKKKKSTKTKGRATDEVPTKGLLPSMGLPRAKRKKNNKKRSRGGAASPVDRDEGPAEGREGALVEAAPDGRPKKRTKRYVEVEPRPSTSDTNAADTTLVDAVGEDSDTPENLSEERRKTSSREGDFGDEPVANERSAPDSSARKSCRPEGSLAKKRRIEFPDRVEFSYDDTTPLILNPLRCAELTRQIRGGTKEMLDEYIDVAFARARLEGKLKSARAAKKELAQENTLPAKHIEVPEGGGLEERPENENLEEVPAKDNLETGDTPVREEESKNVGIEDPVLVSDSSSEGREDEKEEDDRAEETSPPQPVEEVPAAAATENPVSPPTLGTREEDDQDSVP